MVNKGCGQCRNHGVALLSQGNQILDRRMSLRIDHRRCDHAVVHTYVPDSVTAMAYLLQPCNVFSPRQHGKTHWRLVYPLIIYLFIVIRSCHLCSLIFISTYENIPTNNVAFSSICPIQYFHLPTRAEESTG